MPDVRLYVFADSYPCEAVLAAARHKGLDVDRVDLPPVVHAPVMQARFGARTVPGAVIDGRKVHGTSAIFRALDDIAPEPAIFPAAPDHRAAVEDAEAWGAGPFQDIGRRLVWLHFRARPDEVRRWAERDEHAPTRLLKRLFARPMAWAASTANGATVARVQADVQALPGLLERIDGLVADGTIGDPAAPNAADFQILSSVGAWWLLEDLRPLLADRPCAAHALRLFPRYAEGEPIAGGVMPRTWLAS